MIERTRVNSKILNSCGNEIDENLYFFFFGEHDKLVFREEWIDELDWIKPVQKIKTYNSFTDKLKIYNSN